MTKSKKSTLPRYIKLDLKKNHLVCGTPGDHKKCAVARAFHSAGYRYVRTNFSSTVVFTKNYKSTKFIAKHNRKVMKVIDRFDDSDATQRAKIKPQTLTFKVQKPGNIPVV